MTAAPVELNTRTVSIFTAQEVAIAADRLTHLVAMANGFDATAQAAFLAAMGVTAAAFPVLQGTTLAAMRTALGLAIGTNVQAYDANLINAIAADNPQSGSTYTLALTDALKEISLTNATSCAVSIPLNATVAFSVGTRIPIWADAAGTYTIVGVSGVTLNGISGGSRTGTMTVNVSGVRNGVILRKTATDTWTVSGAIGAVA